MATVTSRVSRNQNALFLLLEAPNGRVGEFLSDRAHLVFRRAIDECPKRSHNLKNSHNFRDARKGARGLTATVTNNAEYANYVRRGTESPIPAVARHTETTWVEFYSLGEFWEGRYANGQDPNDWLTRAYNQSALQDRFTDVVVPANEFNQVYSRWPVVLTSPSMGTQL